ncbi:MAG: polyprenol monophosphomannose synthase [Phycisphaerales bacterium]|nr:polyprenol monophosphomannose synthase [Phycisphaerales bacterium]
MVEALPQSESASDATSASCPVVSVVVPTFREAANIAELVGRIERAVPDSEIIIVDDNSNDGTDDVVRGLVRSRVRLHVRTAERGLSSAVIAGCRLARAPHIVVMDADLSHPPESIPAMLAELGSGGDFVIGSRYIAGGSTDSAWTFFRRINSLFATALARPLTKLSDPMSGFFAMRTADFKATQDLNPIGYKIALEMLVKGPFRSPREVPIHFADRKRGESKLSLKEQIRYIRHLARLYRFKFLGSRTVSSPSGG